MYGGFLGVSGYWMLVYVIGVSCLVVGVVEGFLDFVDYWLEFFWWCF